MIELWQPQLEQVEAVREAMRHSKAVLMQSPTGSGKSVMAAYMIASALRKGSRSLFVVPRRELLRQMGDNFQKFSIPHSFVASGYPMIDVHRTKIASAQTLVNKMDRFDANVVFVDETHHGSGTLDRIIDHYKRRNAWIVGLSATPVRLDGRGLDCWYDRLVPGKSVRFLIDNGFLSDYRAFAPSRPDLSGISTVAGDYAKGQLSARMEGDRVLIGDAVRHYKSHAMGKLNVAFCVSIKHSEMVAEQFRAEGVPAAHIDGKTPDDERRRIIRAFAKREILVLSNCELLTFGFDLASNAGIDVTVEAMRDLRPTKSLALQMQKWGRVLRRKPFPAIIFDHGGNIATHGLPCADRDWSLSGREVCGGMKKERDINVRQCPQCYRCHQPDPVCPSCGYLYPVKSREVEEVDGELSEIEVAVERNKKRMEIGMAKDMKALWAIAKERGYKPGWVYKTARAKGLMK